mgnify:CR=1 FL=1|tara:strand:+ start:75 stop:413 length:339 start_codon:yes stop_codon:yes gene_type:complete
MKKICFDLDGVICSNTNGDYENAVPFQKAINKINKLYNEGFYILIFTARFMGRNKDDVVAANKLGFSFTTNQLKKWGLKYHKLIIGKPEFDIVIDDKSLNYDETWIELDFNK